MIQSIFYLEARFEISEHGFNLVRPLSIFAEARLANDWHAGIIGNLLFQLVADCGFRLPQMIFHGQKTIGTAIGTYCLVAWMIQTWIIQIDDPEIDPVFAGAFDIADHSGTMDPEEQFEPVIAADDIRLRATATFRQAGKPQLREVRLNVRPDRYRRSVNITDIHPGRAVGKP